MQCKASQGRAMQGEARQGKAGQGKAKKDRAMMGKAKQVDAGQRRQPTKSRRAHEINALLAPETVDYRIARWLHGLYIQT